MSLKYAVLTVLLDGDASGYDLAKRFDLSVANFWHALPQQLYAELRRLEGEGLVQAMTVVQERRPNKRVFRITREGRAALGVWLREPSRGPSVKSDLLIRFYAADVADAEALLADLARQRAQHEAKLRSYEQLRDLLFHDQTEAEYVRTARRIGPYLTLRRGMMYERENIAWCDWATVVFRRRTRDHRATSSGPTTARAAVTAGAKAVPPSRADPT